MAKEKEKLVPAPLDEKNVTTDWIEELFDDQSALYGSHKMIGFMAGAAMQAEWYGNVLKWKVLDGDGYVAIKRLIERYKERYPEKESPFIVKYQIYSDAYVMKFYWKPEETIVL